MLNPVYAFARLRELLDEYEPSRELSLASTKLDECELWLTRCEPADDAEPAPGRPDRYEDERGVIQDLLAGPIDSVTQISTRTGSVRGNHAHGKTVQWTYVVSGCMRSVIRNQDGSLSQAVRYPGEFFCEPSGLAHAWEALEDTTVLVFTRGPRSGADYESDTRRLAPEDRLL